MRTLHITNGDSVRQTLRDVVPDPIAIVADPLHEGPAPAGLEGRAWCEGRARFLAGASLDEYEDALRTLTEWDDSISTASDYDEVVLWFEHDLFDQLALIRVLDRFVRPTADTRVCLICIDRFDGIDRFVGLGQLTADQLSTLVGRRQPVTERHHQLAHEAWTSFRADDPTDLVRLIPRLKEEPIFPFLGDAFMRFLQEYPSTVNGLSRSADAIAQALISAPLNGHALFARTQAHEISPFMGDSILYHIVTRMAAQRVPLVAIDGGIDCSENVSDLGGARITLTDAGREVAACRQDAVALNGIDEWRGGVHLVGDDRSPWRWDPAAETLVS